MGATCIEVHTGYNHNLIWGRQTVDKSNGGKFQGKVMNTADSPVFRSDGCFVYKRNSS